MLLSQLPPPDEHCVMTGIDTNILVRFFTRDDEAQAARAAEILTTHCSGDNPGFITNIVLVELVWVLSGHYRYARRDIAKAIETLIHAREIQFEYPDAVQYAHRIYANGLGDFSDALIGATSQLYGCGSTLTFDQQAARLSAFESA
ncbi:MAG: PIN domain-containing protein [Coraliomargarita sp. TMED73]|nr:MAG: PIN domain-containing protein [Coraliomargarita sp. TMED73]